MLYILLDNTRGWLLDTGLYRVFGVLDQVQFRVLAAMVLGLVIVLALGRRTITTLTRLKIGDSGLADAEAMRDHSASKRNTPTMGGVLIAGAMLVTTLLLADLRVFYVQAGVIVLIWMAALGGVDDFLKITASRRPQGSRQGLHSWEKLVFQLGIGLLIGIFAYRHGDSAAPTDLAHAFTLPFQRTYVPGTGETNPALLFLPIGVFVLFAMLMIAGMSNAVNITDGMDGLATGITSAVSIGLVIVLLIAGAESAAQFLLVPHVPYADELAVLAGAMAGAALGFLWWNCAPAQMFMGDTGSLCLGGVIGYLAIVARQEVVVVIMCGVFIAELASVATQIGVFKISRRLTGTGKRVFRIAPYHHALHLRGWTEGQVVVRAWIAAIGLVLLALASIKLR
ncbi:MAG: phospho-N-acetylmuramoyl-pentapeptide-transferase [Planctomycetota bacterium]